ncbi:MAG: hypothetical protein BWX56_01346 [Euryarchaeota archaeon ADurb.Bin023]|uniref:Uncharacterized protein n=1 Tax=Candidatus Methanofastidiosum methylothiophilum TaxID=1705564 RepID=A0A150JKP9_9EURY|nr:MAG: hypothetical protein APG09_00897 [Candidatus Methanofastidiosum methylthiophilus]OQC50366.1 MAG: hypothetical protein BWX56_01346 [Euryarchaeota archaeon ADurb.Bin023]
MAFSSIFTSSLGFIWESAGTSLDVHLYVPGESKAPAGDDEMYFNPCPRVSVINTFSIGPRPVLFTVMVHETFSSKVAFCVDGVFSIVTAP